MGKVLRILRISTVLHLVEPYPSTWMSKKPMKESVLPSVKLKGDQREQKCAWKSVDVEGQTETSALRTST